MFLHQQKNVNSSLRKENLEGIIKTNKRKKNLQQQKHLFVNTTVCEPEMGAT